MSKKESNPGPPEDAIKPPPPPAPPKGRLNASLDPFVIQLLRNICIAFDLPLEIMVKHFTITRKGPL